MRNKATNNEPKQIEPIWYVINVKNDSNNGDVDLNSAFGMQK